MTKTKPKVIFLDWYNTLSISKFWGHWENKDNPHFEKFEKIQSSFFWKGKTDDRSMDERRTQFRRDSKRNCK